MKLGKFKITARLPKKADLAIQITVILLILFGTLMIVSTNVGRTSSDSLILVKVLAKQAIFVVAAYLLMTFFANNFTMEGAKKRIWLIGILLALVLGATLLFPDVNGSKAWIQINVGGINASIQPAEFVKVFMVVIMGIYVEIAGRRRFAVNKIIRIPIIFYAIYNIIIFIQPDFGAIVVIGLICAICFLIPSHPSFHKYQKILLIVIGIGTMLFLFLMTPAGLAILEKIPVLGHIITRFENSLNPFEDPFNDGYQMVNGLYGFARGGLFGNGLGQSLQKYGWLTQSDNDFILSIVVEELGVFGLFTIVIGYSVIIYRLFYYAFKSKSEGYKIILIGIASYIFIHFLLNVGGVSGLIPLTGVPLLFISSGGSSLMSVMIGIGIAQAIIAKIRNQADGTLMQ